MCGIAVYLGRDCDSGERFAARSNRLLVHRGPDDEGIRRDDGVVLGHRRLSILDLSSAGHQPMVSPDGRWALVYNGEVYNHQELRESMCRDWTFRSRSDSETVLAVLALHGPEALKHMVGMWALALWDADEQRLLISRDRYGQKPLYWRRAGDGYLFASEIKPLLGEGERPAPYTPAVAEYLATGNYGHLGERTFFRDIYNFPPAHWAYVRAGDSSFTPRRYWRFPAVSRVERRPYGDAERREFRRRFDEAVRSQLMSDVSVGVTLSGGLDSSAIVGALVQSGECDRVNVFTAQAPGSAFDESRYVRAVEDKWPGRLNVHRVNLDGMRLSEHVRGTVAIQEEPFGDPSIIAHGLLMDAAQEAGVSVLLGGQGGDEVLFGYPFMTHSLMAASLRGGRLAWAFGEARKFGLNGGAMARVGLSAFLPGMEQWARGRSRLRRRSWLTAPLREASQAEAPALAPASDARAVWLEAVERFALPHLTHYDDRNGMARSVEGRMPFLDHRLAETVCGFAEEAYISGGMQKRILRESCGDLLPQAVLDRRDKIGFFTPLRGMLRAESDWAQALITDDLARSLNFYDIGRVKTCAENIAHGDGGSDGPHLVWRALCVRVWAETFNVVAM